VADYRLGVDTDGFVRVFTAPAEGDDGRRDVVAYPVRLLAAEGASTPPETTSQPSEGRDFTVDVDALEATPLSGESVMAAAWGDRADQIGRDPVKGFGPCCFDVTDDGTVLLVDSQNLRVVVYPPRGNPRVLAAWDAGDFVPDGIATDGQRAFVYGSTNRPGRPYDLIVLSVATGEQLGRGETSLDSNADLRWTADGLYAGGFGLGGWVRLAEFDGIPIPVASQPTFDLLPDETTLGVTYLDRGSSGVVIEATPAGDSPTTAYTLRYQDLATLDVIGYPGSPEADGAIAVVASELGADTPLTLVRLGRQGDTLLADAFSIQGSFAAEIGPFNIVQYRFGGVYLMRSTDNGVEIARYELP
jgi:hypothetical protein